MLTEGRHLISYFSASLIGTIVVRIDLVASMGMHVAHVLQSQYWRQRECNSRVSGDPYILSIAAKCNAYFFMVM